MKPDDMPTEPGAVGSTAGLGADEFQDNTAEVKRLAVAVWKRREKWCEDAYVFWQGEYCDTSDSEARDMMRTIEGLWCQAKREHEKFASAQVVGGRWLTLASLRGQPKAPKK